MTDRKTGTSPAAPVAALLAVLLSAPAAMAEQACAQVSASLTFCGEREIWQEIQSEPPTRAFFNATSRVSVSINRKATGVPGGASMAQIGTFLGRLYETIDARPGSVTSFNGGGAHAMDGIDVFSVQFMVNPEDRPDRTQLVFMTAIPEGEDVLLVEILMQSDRRALPAPWTEAEIDTARRVLGAFDIAGGTQE